MQSHASLKKEINELKRKIAEISKSYRAATAMSVEHQRIATEASENFRREKAIVNHMIDY